jgi:hypothetical protein
MDKEVAFEQEYGQVADALVSRTGRAIVISSTLDISPDFYHNQIPALIERLKEAQADAELWEMQRRDRLALQWHEKEKEREA